MSSDSEMLKLVKEYLLNNPNSTARQISEHFVENDFGIRKEYNISKISRLIQKYGKKTKQYKWFNVNSTMRNGKKVYTIRKD